VFIQNYNNNQGDHLLRRSWNNSTGFPFVNELTINLLFLHKKHAVHPRGHAVIP